MNILIVISLTKGYDKEMVMIGLSISGRSGYCFVFIFLIEV